MLARQVERNVPEAVDAEHGRADPRLTYLRLGQVEANERLRINGRAELAELDPERKVRRGR